ncbi:hypothetical protein [Bacillus velezensis]|uniref:hypothetical protein n=1 Tax=Bacillus velezensis TaxID=492670 RepID=UPI001E52E0D3|nr:hypothetical protein [Bacillus velezensis]
MKYILWFLYYCYLAYLFWEDIKQLFLTLISRCHYSLCTLKQRNMKKENTFQTIHTVSQKKKKVSGLYQLEIAEKGWKLKGQEGLIKTYEKRGERVSLFSVRGNKRH